jgi:hypothetical protein
MGLRKMKSQLYWGLPLLDPEFDDCDDSYLFDGHVLELHPDCWFTADFGRYPVKARLDRSKQEATPQAVVSEINKQAEIELMPFVQAFLQALRSAEIEAEAERILAREREQEHRRERRRRQALERKPRPRRQLLERERTRQTLEWKQQQARQEQALRQKRAQEEVRAIALLRYLPSLTSQLEKNR